VGHRHDETVRILNILGTPLGCCDAQMKKNETGSIVNISSAAGLVGSVVEETTDAVLSKSPMGFAAHSIDIAYGVLFLTELRFVTGTDTDIIIDGGYAAH
jgi:NAD(P)-dependent dehydrogenase (short-subunit alcohol dehydrogenase family)